MSDLLLDQMPLNCRNCKKRMGSVFHDLSSDQLDDVSQLKSCVCFKKGQVVLSEGSRPQGVYCVHNGKFKLYKTGVEGKEQILRFVHDGDLIGYRSILTDEPLSASVAALEDSYACYIPKSSFFKLIEQNPKFSLNVLKASCHDLGEAGKMIASLAQKTVQERLAEILLLMESTFGTDADGCIDLKFTREEMANMVGTATESAIRLLSEFKDLGYVETKGRKISLRDKEALLEKARIYL